MKAGGRLYRRLQLFLALNALLSGEKHVLYRMRLGTGRLIRLHYLTHVTRSQAGTRLLRPGDLPLKVN